MKRLIYAVLLSFIYVSWVSAEYTIAFVHLGKQLPGYISIALDQARLFNPEESIVLLANQEAINKTSVPSHVTIIPIESIFYTPEHQYFIDNHHLDGNFREGFWRYATERFYVLYDFMKQLNVSRVFHLESDNMLYAHLAEYMPLFDTYYCDTIAATFDNDGRCIPGFIYFSTISSLEKLIRFMNNNLSAQKNDMHSIAAFRKNHPKSVKQLPIVPEAYLVKHKLKSNSGHCAQNPQDYVHYSQEFHAIFDAAAIGQYLGGIDPRNNNNAPSIGFINESCVFNPAHLTYEWALDEEGRNIPYACINNKPYKIINLHIHSKKLDQFVSA